MEYQHPSVGAIDHAYLAVIFRCITQVILIFKVLSVPNQTRYVIFTRLDQAKTRQKQNVETTETNKIL